MHPHADRFAQTLQAAQQLHLLGSDAATAENQAARDFSDLDVAGHLRRLREQMREHGHQADLELDPNGHRARITWKLPGASEPAAHRRDRYTLAIEITAGGASARFVGPGRRSALYLRTRNATPDTLQRWSTTFVEWALTARETR